MPIINTVIQGGGTTPTGTLPITTNGIYDVTNYASADVQVPTTVPAHYIEKTVDANGKLINSTNMINLNGVTDISDYVLANTYYQTSFPANTSVDLSGLTTVSGQYACSSMFNGCINLTSVDLSSLTTISGQYACNSMFFGCAGLTSIDFLSSLTTISGFTGCASMFAGCTGLTSVDFSSLTSILSNNGCQRMFAGCTGLTSVDFSSLTSITGSTCCQQMFNACVSLTRISFYALTPSSFGSQTSQFNSMLNGITGCTVHFPMAIQSTIGSWASVTGGFSGTNTTILFDIVTSLTGADTNTYTRKQKDSTSTATAWTLNDTLYYTSGTTEPTVGATIYSDAACTVAVTTIDAIA